MKELKRLRKKIDKIDNQIIKKLAKRNNLSLKVGQVKSKLNESIVDTAREKELFQRYELLSSEYGLDSNLVKKIFELVINHSRELQK